MANTLNASTSSGLIQTADTSGIIELQSSGSTKLTVNSSGTVIDTLKSSSGVLAAQNGMTGIGKAWVNFNRTNGVNRASFNVSSVTRTGTGLYTINFTTAMPDANYSCGGLAFTGTSGDYNRFISLYNAAPTTTSFQIATALGSNSASDCTYVTAQVLGN
jgi:hypothetical protein